MVMYSVLVLLVPLIFIAGLAASVVHLVRRRNAMLRQRAAQAAAVGWYRVPPNPWLLYVAADQFREGRPGEAYAGEYRGRGLCVLDYSYTTSNGKSQQTHTVNLVALTLPVALPPLTVTADSRLRRMLGGRDLELENQQFNDRFRVVCGDDRYGSAVVHPRMMECMLLNPALEWRIAGNALVAWGTGAFAVPDVVARLEAMSRVIDLIPPFVLRDYGQPAFS